MSGTGAGDEDKAFIIGPLVKGFTNTGANVGSTVVFVAFVAFKPALSKDRLTPLLPFMYEEAVTPPVTDPATAAMAPTATPT